MLSAFKFNNMKYKLDRLKTTLNTQRERPNPLKRSMALFVLYSSLVLGKRALEGAIHDSSKQYRVKAWPQRMQIRFNLPNNVKVSSGIVILYNAEQFKAALVVSG